MDGGIKVPHCFLSTTKVRILFNTDKYFSKINKKKQSTDTKSCTPFYIELLQ